VGELIKRFLFIAASYKLMIAIGVMGSVHANDRTKMLDALNIEPGIGKGLMPGMNDPTKDARNYPYIPDSDVAEFPVVDPSEDCRKAWGNNGDSDTCIQERQLDSDTSKFLWQSASLIDRKVCLTNARTVGGENFYIGVFVCLTARVNFHREAAHFQP